MDNTTQKLSEALNTLINAYEELQKENEGLQNTITDLNNKITNLESKNKELEDNVDNLNDNTQKQESDITSMLGKIESLLHIRKSDSTKDKAIESEPVKEEEPYASSISVEDIKLETESSAPQQNSSKIDLNRMESLLSGFNKK